MLLGLAVNAAVQAWMYRNYQAVFHSGDSTSAGYWAGFWVQFSWVKLICSGLLFLVLGGLAQQRAEQRALIRELEAEQRQRQGQAAARLPGAKLSFVQKVFRLFNF
jgi:hypothetical protein